ncbi:type 1 glutamine amidotransferase [Bradyrhizobium yuanmingense]|uniref:type 1 glutamine amidotransferase n=1 Tax=Bradyrhizobium yuanmingense TaxID=108015 RepID=UPI0023BA0F91|nr:type 1 glutamine amidotransferase [Bradyrhizobium yuanmingense]MDF0519855.1 type 1 glutamine amidotransferase [Bradyrhizobium yuanmingense]
MARITIIETGAVPQKYRERHGSFPDMFARMIRAEEPAATIEVVSIPNGDALPDPSKLEAVLITGAAVGVYDRLDWIAPLEDFVRTAYANKTPMVGVCFGHQLIAQALGGTVRKSEHGWGIGRHVYQVLPENGVIDGEAVAIAASHQDQVIEPPSDALTILSSDFTPHAGLLYANGATLTVQPHPEFDVGFAQVCCDLRDGKAPDEVVATARASLAEPMDNAKLGGAIARFLTRR